MNDSRIDGKKPMTREQVENYIMLASQRDERWFEFNFTDPEMNADPTARAMMDKLADSIYSGVAQMVFDDRAALMKSAGIGGHISGSN